MYHVGVDIGGTFTDCAWWTARETTAARRFVDKDDPVAGMWPG